MGVLSLTTLSSSSIFFFKAFISRCTTALSVMAVLTVSFLLYLQPRDDSLGESLDEISKFDGTNLPFVISITVGVFFFGIIVRINLRSF